MKVSRNYLLTTEQIETLGQIAHIKAVSVSSLVREAVDLFLKQVDNKYKKVEQKK